MKQKHLTKKTVALFLIAGTVCLTTGCDDTYDINKISGDMQLFENGLTAPVGNSTKFYLTEFIEENDILTVRDGKYAIHFEGNSPTTISIPEVKINPISSSFEDASINFLESISMLPGMQEALDATGYTSGPLPELGIEISGIMATIPEKSEPISINLPEVPAEIISISSMRPAPQTLINVILHSDGFPKQITKAKFDFTFKIPQQLIVEPTQSDVTLDEYGNLHISREVSCNNGSCTEEIPLLINSVYFEPAVLRQPDGNIVIETDLVYSGAISINEQFDFSGWDPDLLLSIGAESGAIHITEASACIEKAIDPIEYTYELNDLPDFLQNENTCLDLTSIMINLSVANNSPAALETELKLQSNFLDGSTSGDWLSTLQPIAIAPLTTQDIIVTNDDTYAGTPGYIPGLEALMYRVPRTIKVNATPRIPANEISIEFNTDYALDFGYDINVPISFGNDFLLHYEDTFPDLNLDMSGISDAATSFELEGEAVSTLPIDLDMTLTPLDAEGNVMQDIVISQEATLRGNATTHFSITVEDRSNGALQQIDAIHFSVSGTAENGGALSPDQYLQFNNLRIVLSDGIKIQ